MKRQALRTTIRELRKLADDFFHELLENNPKGIYKNVKEVMDQKIQINIVNKEGLSDTWRIEK